MKPIELEPLLEDHPNLTQEDIDLYNNMIPAFWYYSTGLFELFSMSRLVDAGLVLTKDNPIHMHLAYKRKP